MPPFADRRSARRACKAVLAALSLASIVACKTFADQTLRTRSALDANDPQGALRATNAALHVKGPDKIPEPLEKNDALLLLDRATVLQALSDYEASSRDFGVADKALEILDFSRTAANEIARYLFTDTTGPYKARPYEKLMLNSLNMVNYLALGDLEGARVEARRFTVMRDFLTGEGSKNRSQVGDAGIMGSYLAGYTFEQSGNAEEALRYYDDALQSAQLSSLAGPVRRLMTRSGYRTPALDAISKLPTSSGAPRGSPDAELLIIVSYGRVPALEARRLPIGLALTIAAAFLPVGLEQEALRMAGQGLVTWVNYPELGASTEVPAPVVRVDDVQWPVEQVANVDAIARQSWEQGKARVVAAAVIRMVTRAAIGAGIGVATGKATDRSGLGVLAALVTQASLAAADKPDTRSWATLPAHVGVVRARVPAGTRRVEVQIDGRVHTADLSVAAGQWLLVDITDLSRT